jgi:alpha-1,2-mannosyltransferase
VLVVTVLGLLCAAMLDRAGHAMLGLLMAALIGLLDSPISWEHHWVWVVPGMMVAAYYALRAWQAGRRRGAFGCATLAVGMLLVFVPWPGSLWSVKTSGPGNFTHGLIWAAPNTPVTQYVKYGDLPWFLEYHWSGLQVFAGNAYILAGFVLLAILGFTAMLTSGPVQATEPASADPAEAVGGSAEPVDA